MKKKLKQLICAIMTVMLMFTTVLLPVEVSAQSRDFETQSLARAGSSIKVQTPVLTRLHNSNDSISVWWNPVKDARGYVVYRKINSGSWKRVKTTGSTFFMDMDVKAGYTYTYTVKAYKRYNGKNYYSSYDKRGKSGKLTTVVNYTPYTRPGELYWKETTGATGYYIYRAAEKSGKYNRIANITDLKFLHYEDPQLDGTCYYKVTPYAAINGKNIICTSSAAVKVSYYKDNPNVVDREAPLDKLPTRKTVQVCARQTGQLGWDFSLPKYTEDYPITVTSSNPSVATVVVCDYEDYFTYNGKTVYQKGYMLNRKGYGKTTITVTVKLGGKTYKKSCEYNYVKHKNPFSSLKIGSKDYVSYANKECEVILNKMTFGKLNYKLKPGYKIEEIRAVYKNEENQSKFKVLKNGENVPSGTHFIEFRVSDMFGTGADIVLSTYKYQS